MSAERLEQRLPFATVGIQLTVEISVLTANAATDTLGNPGDFYAVVDSGRGGNLFNTRDNPLTGNQNFNGTPGPSPWRGQVSYAIDDEALLYGSRQQTRDLLYLSIFDYDDLSDDDIVDINPFRGTSFPFIPQNGNVVLDVDLRSGLVVGPYGQTYQNGAEGYSLGPVSRTNTNTRLVASSRISLKGSGNEFALDPNNPNQIAGAEINFRITLKYFDFDGTGSPPIDSDGDGLFDI